MSHHQSIGFTAELGGSNDDSQASDFMPFFTPNRRPLPNMLEHVEPAGEAVLHILECHFFITFFFPSQIRSGQVRIHPRIHFTSSVDSDPGTSHTDRPATHSYRGSRMFDISVYSPVRLLRRRDPLHERSPGRDLPQGCAARWWCTRIEKHHGTCL
jgi:hypothetical protein